MLTEFVLTGRGVETDADRTVERREPSAYIDVSSETVNCAENWLGMRLTDAVLRLYKTANAIIAAIAATATRETTTSALRIHAGARSETDFTGTGSIRKGSNRTESSCAIAANKSQGEKE